MRISDEAIINANNRNSLVGQILLIIVVIMTITMVTMVMMTMVTTLWTPASHISEGRRDPSLLHLEEFWAKKF